MFLNSHQLIFLFLNDQHGTSPCMVLFVATQGRWLYEAVIGFLFTVPESAKVLDELAD